MAKVKLTKQELRHQQMKLKQLKEYLPTLQLKKSMLQYELQNTKSELEELNNKLNDAKGDVLSFSKLLTKRLDFDILEFVKVKHVQKKYENIAGVEIPIFERAIFQEADYFLFDTPSWIDYAIIKIRKMINLKENMNAVEEKKHALEKELHDVSIRVNLFEKILIPRTEENIRIIKIFLGDLELAAVSQAKVAKLKIEAKKS